MLRNWGSNVKERRRSEWGTQSVSQHRTLDNTVRVSVGKRRVSKVLICSVLAPQKQVFMQSVLWNASMHVDLQMVGTCDWEKVGIKTQVLVKMSFLYSLWSSLNNVLNAFGNTQLLLATNVSDKTKYLSSKFLKS